MIQEKQDFQAKHAPGLDELMTVYSRISNPLQRKTIVALMSAIADMQTNDATSVPGHITPDLDLPDMIKALSLKTEK